MVARQVQEGGTVSAGDLHYIPLTGLLMAPITEIGPNCHQPKLDRAKVLLSTDRTNLKSTASDFASLLYTKHQSSKSSTEERKVSKSQQALIQESHKHERYK